MPPKKHLKFEDDGGGIKSHGNQVPKVKKKDYRPNKRSKVNHLSKHNNKKNTLDEAGIPGPLSVERLKALRSNYEQLSDGDLRFHSSADSSSMNSDDTDEPAERNDDSEPTDEDGDSSDDDSCNNQRRKQKKDKSDRTPAPLFPRKLEHHSNNNNNNHNQHQKNVKKGKVVTFYDDDDDDDDYYLNGVKETNAKTKQLLKQTRMKLLKDRQQLPMYRSRKEVLRHVMNNRVTVLLGETGSGKSTQLPQLIYEHDPNERIAVTQPRRVAAINLASRVADESGCVVGSKVGYSVRFQNKSTPDYTKIKYLTDGMLMRELILDPNLKQYTTVILDEAHERTVLTDMLMGLMKQLLRKRPDLRLVVMSATLDADRFAEFFDQAPVVFVEGKTYPVQRFYLREPIEDIVDGAIQCVCQTNMAEPEGDILVFLAGQEEIEKCVDRLNSISGEMPKEAPRLVGLPLYASLPPAAQQRAFEKVGQHERKVIFATNIAETSLTISGVKYVVDSGLRKVRVWKPELGLDTLHTAAISQASAAQRMGRAGRENAGKCFRLFTESTYQEFATQTEPEILRCDIASTILMLKRAGVNDVLGFDWVQAPEQRAIESALLKLYALKAIDDNGEITKLGHQMVLLPVAPQLAAVLIYAKAQSLGLLYKVLDIVSCLSVEDLLVNPHPDQRDEINERRHSTFPSGRQDGDLIMLQELYSHYRGLVASGGSSDRREQREWLKSLGVNPKGMDNVRLIRKQLCRYMKVDSNDDDADQITSRDCTSEQILRAFLHGYVGNTALGLPDRRFKTVIHQQTLNVHPSSMIFGTKPEAIMYMECIVTSKSYARMVSPIEISWLQEVAPHLLGRARD